MLKFMRNLCQQGLLSVQVTNQAFFIESNDDESFKDFFLI